MTLKAEPLGGHIIMAKQIKGEDGKGFMIN